MREVLISIKPKWCELIVSGKKTVEVRKTKPKLETHFKVYIYCTKDNTFAEKTLRGFDENGKAIHYKANKGKVIGEFVCDHIDPFLCMPLAIFSTIGTLEQTCLTAEQISKYFNGKNGYGWHITDLVVYDKPRELNEFKQVRSIRGYHKETENFAQKLLHSTRLEVNFLKRPPQSWCYVKSTEPRQTADGHQ